jgi:hypothetical protein
MTTACSFVMQLGQRTNCVFREGQRPGRTTTQLKMQEYSMILKQIGLIALAATFITGSATVASAESNISGSGGGASGSLSTSSALQGDWMSEQNAAVSTRLPPGHAAYGYAREYRPAKHSRSNVRMKNK